MGEPRFIQLTVCSQPFTVTVRKRTNANPFLVAQRHHGVDGAKKNQRERKWNVDEQPAMEPAVKLLLASELARFVANVFEVGKRGVGRGRQESSQPCKGTGRTCGVAKTAADLFWVFEKGTHFVQIETAERHGLLCA